MSEKKYYCPKCGHWMPLWGPELGEPEMCSSCRKEQDCAGCLCKQAQNAIWDLLRENHVSYAEKGVVDTVRRLIEAWHEGQDEVDRLRNDISHQVSQQWRTKCLVAEKFNKELAERVDLLEAIRAAQGETIKDLRSQFKLAIGRDEQTLSYLLGVAKTESDRLKALALRAWHSYRSGLACQNGLTDDDIETLVKMDAERSENGVPVGGCTPVQSQ